MHALLIGDVLIQVKHLVNGTSITRAVAEGMRDIEYFQIELATHEVIVAEGAPVETLLVTNGRESFSNFVEYERLYGPAAGLAMVPYAPVPGYSRAHAHLEALLRLGVPQVVDVRDPIQEVAYDRFATRATKSWLTVQPRMGPPDLRGRFRRRVHRTQRPAEMAQPGDDACAPETARAQQLTPRNR